MNKKYLLGAAGLLAVGAISSIAIQSFAQSPSPAVQTTIAPVASAALQTKADTGTDAETNDGNDTALSAGQTSTVEQANDKETNDDGGTAQSSSSTNGAADGENPND